MTRVFDTEAKFEEFKKKLEEYTEGEVQANKEEFLKLLVFYEVVDMPFLNDVVEKLGKAMLGKR